MAFSPEEELLKKTVKVEAILLRGLERTNDHIVLRELANLKSAGSLEEVKDQLVDAYANLMALDIFHAVDIAIDKGNKSPKGCVVVVRVVEKNLLGFHTGTYVQGTEGTVEASLNLNNPFGEAEQVSFGLEYGTQRTNLCSLTYTVPKFRGNPVIADFRMQQLLTDRQPWSSYIERLRGGMMTFTSETGRHAVSYELGWRRLSDPSGLASRTVASQLGDQVKSAVKYSFFANNLDNPIFPRNGWSLRASTEVAGIGRNHNLVRFMKQQVGGQIALPVGIDAAFHLEGSAGILLPWGGQKTHISDRFYLGGICPEGLRGFRMKGVGPVDDRRPKEGAATAATGRDAIGGDISWSVLAALRFSLPVESLQAAGLRGQIFMNCGNLAQLDSGRRFGDIMSDFVGKFRASVGVGLIWPTPIGRLEINLASVMRQQPSDQMRTGIQFGFTTTI